MKKILLLAAMALLAAACSHKDSFTIEGTLQFGAGKTIYLEELTPEGPLFIDSIRLDKKGSFKYRYQMPYESFYNLHSNETDYIMLLPQPGEHITIEGDHRNLQWTYNVKGSPESVLLMQLQQYTNEGIDSLKSLVLKLDNLDAQLQSNQLTQTQYDAEKKLLDSVYLSYYGMQQDYVTHMIQEHPGSLATLIALYKDFNRHPLIDPRYNIDYYEEVLSSLEATKPDNPHTINFHNDVEKLKYRVKTQSVNI